MALQTQHLEVSFDSGADESQEDYASGVPLSVLTDFEYRKDRGLRKRYGWQSKGTYDAGLGAAAIIASGTHGAVLTRNAALQFGDAIDVDASPRIQHGARITSSRFANLVDSADLQDCDTAYCTDGRVCVVATRYDGSAYSVVIAVFDTSGGLLHREVVTSARRARVVAQGSGRFNVFYTSTSSNVISVRSIIGDPTQGGTQSTTAGLFNNHATYKAYDVCAGPSSDAFVVYNEVTTGRMRIARVTAALSISADYDTTLTTMDYPSICYHPTTGHVHVAYGHRGTTGGYFIEVNSTPSSTLRGPTAVAAGATVVRTAIVPLLDSTSPVTALFQSSAAFSVAMDVYVATVPDNFGSTTETTYYRVMFNTAPFGLPSSQFDTTYGSDRPYAGFLPRPQGTPAGSNIPTAVLGMISNGGIGTSLGGGTGLTYSPRSFGPVATLITDGAATPVTDGAAGRIVAGASDTYYVAVPYIYAEPAGVEKPAVLVLKLNTAPTPEPLVEFGGSAYVGGGILRYYDGQRLGEVTPPWVIDNVDATGGGGGLNPAAGSYAYAAHLEWVDGSGDTHRGPVTTIPAASFVAGSVSVVLSCHAPSLLDTTDTVQKWVIRLFRTQAGGSTFTFVDQKEISAASSSVTITDSYSDLTISDHEELYTDGGIMQAECPPGFSSLVEHRNRLWGISNQDPRSLWPSKVKEEAISPEFNAALVQRVDSAAAPVALASLDDKLIVFTGADAYAIVGDGPPATGVDSGVDSWSPAELLVRGVGASSGNAALSTPLGVIVHGPQGFKLIGRDLGATDIGGALLDSAPGTTSVLRAINFPKRQQAWFLMANAKLIVFDYARGKLRWSRFTVKNGTETPVDIASVGGTPHILTDAGTLYYMSTSVKDDAGTFVTAGLTTGWIRPDQLLGECRFRVLHLYGNAASTSGMTISVQTQGGEPTFFTPTLQTATWTGTELSVAGTPAHVRHRLKYQRGHALRFALAQVAGNAVTSAGFEPLGFGLEYGSHYRPGKTPASSNPG